MKNGFVIHYKDSQKAKQELSYAVKNMKNLPGLIDHCELLFDLQEDL